MSIKQSNYWRGTVSEPAKGVSQALPESVDVAIVGAGFCGLSAARALGKRGMVLTGMKLPVPTLISRYGRELVQRMYAASLESIDLVEQIVKEEGIACSFSRCGHLEVACKQGHFDAFAAAAARIKREFNHELHIVPRTELREEIGSNIYFGALVDETSAGVNPAQYVTGLAKSAHRAG